MSAVSVGTEHCLGPLAQIPRGEGRQFHFSDGSRPDVAVFHLRSGEVRATQVGCPHRNGPLADGLIGGTTLICPLHGRKFDLTTGEALSDGCGLTTFPVRVTESDDIMLGVDPAPKTVNG